jgi:hypothetical protein
MSTELRIYVSNLNFSVSALPLLTKATPKQQKLYSNVQARGNL